MKKEIWKDIKGYEGYYQVSNMGNVRSLDRTIIDSLFRARHIMGVKIKPFKNRKGYACVELHKNSKAKAAKVHHLVFDTFTGLNRNSFVIDHIDGNPSNNHIDNLQLLTNRENVSKGYSTKQKSSKYTGVYKFGNKWQSAIYKNGKSHYLGTFNCETVAHIAYQKALTTNK